MARWRNGWDRALARHDVLRTERPRHPAVEPLADRLAPHVHAIRDLARADRALIALYGRDDMLVVAAAAGGGLVPGEEVGPSPISERALVNGPLLVRPVAPDDALRALGSDWVGAVRLEAGGAPIGLVAAGGDAAPRRRTLRRLTSTAARASPSLERIRNDDAERRSRLGADHARSQLTLIAAASAALAPALSEYKDVLGTLADVVVPDFADLIAVDLVTTDGSVERIAARDAAGAGTVLDTERWRAAVQEALRAGGATLVTDKPGASDRGRGALHESHGLTSWALVPVRSRGLSLGAITIGTRAGRRGLRQSDVSAYHELAARCALAIERVLLFQEARAAASTSERRAAELLRAVEAAPVIAQAATVVDVVNRAAQQAARVMLADEVVVVLDNGQRVHKAAWSATVTFPTPSAELEAAAEAASLAGRTIFSAGGSCVAQPLPRGDGSQRGVIAVRSSVGNPEPALLALFGQVISAAIEHVELFEQATENEARLRAVVDSTPLAIVELSRAAEVIDYNQAAGAMFGWTTRTPPLDPVTGELFAMMHARLLAREHIVDERAVIRRGDGRAVEVSLAAALLGEAGLLCVLTDVTDRLRIEEELQQSRRMEAVGRLAGGVAHDFNNLLTVINGYTDLIAHRLGPDHPMADDIQAVRGAGGRAVRLTEQLLTISRKRVVETTVFEVNVAVREISEIVRRLIGEDIELTVDLDAGAGCVGMDRVQLDQVLLNLAVNARDAMPAGGALVLATARRDRWSVITVTDTGEGMDEATMERCFEPFFTTRGPERGTGLGLATTYGVVVESGGTITVDSEIGRGTRFEVSLPHVADPAGAAVRPGVAAAASHDATVLLVEDEGDVRQFAGTVLREAGFSVHEARDATEALALAAEIEPAVLITDVVMPGMGGPELAASLLSTRPGLQVLFMSGYPDPGDGQPARAVQSESLLSKPFSPDQLIAAVERALLAQGSKR